MRFSTFLAAFLVASGFSFNVLAAGPTGAGSLIELKGNECILLNIPSSLSDLAIVPNGDLLTVTEIVPEGGSVSMSDFETLNRQLWTVYILSTPTEDGNVLSYRFVNKHTGQLLSIKLQTDVKQNGTTPAVTSAGVNIDPAGNSEWSWDTTNGYLYAIKGDSIFWLENDLKLKSVKGNSLSDIVGTTQLKINANTFSETDYVSLTPQLFNELLTTYDRQLFFNNDKNVSAGETNVLTDVNWTALPAVTSFDGSNISEDVATEFYLFNGVVVEDSEKKQFLQVSPSFYNTENTLSVLKVDTVNYEPEFETNATTGLTEVKPLVTTDYNLVGAGVNAVLSANFSGEYYLAQDSLVLFAVNKPALIPVATTLANLKTKYTGLTAVDYTYYEAAVIAY